MTTANAQPTTIPVCNPVLGSVEKEWLIRCIDSGFVSSVGPLIGEFEKRFAEFTGARYAVATASGTAALHVALHALGVRRTDTVAVPDLTFIASINPILYGGAQPAVVDVDRQSWCLDVKLLDPLCRKMEQQGRPLKAVIPVHLFGCACDMPALRELAAQYHFLIVEDATEALGTRIGGRHTGTFGEVGCFSFNGNKLITTGAGGMIVTDNKDLADRIRYLVNQARDPGDRFLHSEMGFNYRMSNLAAALGQAQMDRLPDLLAAKRRIADRYSAGLAGLPGLQLHPNPSCVEGSFWLYSMVVDDAQVRDDWIRRLGLAGISARKFFTPLHQQPYLRGPFWSKNADGTVGLNAEGVSDELSARGINLPSSADLTEEDQQRVIAAIRSLALQSAGTVRNYA